MVNLNRSNINFSTPSGNRSVNEEAIDLTLWIFLMYNITSNTKKMKWSTNPKAKQKEYWHDIQRLKNIRNRLAHIPKAELSEEKFWDLWEETKMVLLRLDVSEDNIDGYLARDLEPEKARQAVQEIKEQYLSDLGVLLDARRNENRKLEDNPCSHLYPDCHLCCGFRLRSTTYC